MLRSCRLCSRSCGVNRLEGERGYCGLDGGAYWFREIIHYGLEFELIPAHAIYLTGCNMRCAFCTATQWNAAPMTAEPWDTDDMRRRVAQRRREGANMLQFVGGEPTVSLPAVLELLAALPVSCRVAWDSNMHMSAQARELLDGVVDVYVADFKYGNERCAMRLADAPNYVATVTANLLFAEQTASLIVRHLLMPGHLDCCFRPVLDWLTSSLRRPRLSLRTEYMPPAGPPGPAPGGYVTEEEYRAALEAAQESGIELLE